jgi:hypothetical protein
VTARDEIDRLSRQIEQRRERSALRVAELMETDMPARTIADALAKDEEKTAKLEEHLDHLVRARNKLLAADTLMTKLEATASAHSDKLMDADAETRERLFGIFGVRVFITGYKSCAACDGTGIEPGEPGVPRHFPLDLCQVCHRTKRSVMFRVEGTISSALALAAETGTVIPLRGAPDEETVTFVRSADTA